jgi:hypothetical protein
MSCCRQWANSDDIACAVVVEERQSSGWEGGRRGPLWGNPTCLGTYLLVLEGMSDEDMVPLFSHLEDMIFGTLSQFGSGVVFRCHATSPFDKSRRLNEPLFEPRAQVSTSPTFPEAFRLSNNVDNRFVYLRKPVPYPTRSRRLVLNLNSPWTRRNTKPTKRGKRSCSRNPAKMTWPTP